MYYCINILIQSKGGVYLGFEFDNNIPIYIQLVEQIKLYIISGKIQPGERLPSVRELAVQNKVNPNTMQRALSELEDKGLIYTERTNGKYVTEDRNLINMYKKEYADELVDKFFDSMKNLGYNKSDAIKYLK